MVACSDDPAKPAATSAQTAPSTPASSAPAPPGTQTAPPSVPQETAPPADSTATSYRTVASVIQIGTLPPMIGFALTESFPPQGGDLVLSGFSWDDVDGEQTEAGTTWLDGIEFVGHRTADGKFALTQKAKPGEAPLSALTYDQETAGCADTTFQPMLDKLSELNLGALGIIAKSEYTFDGHCGVAITAEFDTSELHAAVDCALGAGADVSYDFLFLPVSGGTG